MSREIEWSLFNNGQLIDMQKGTLEENNSNILKYTDQYGAHLINKKEKLYQKDSVDHKMIINFLNKTCLFVLENKEEVMFDIECSFQNRRNELVLTYCFDNEIKKIVVRIK